MPNHVMIDLETMGCSPSAAIVAVGAVRFDPLGVVERSGYFYRVVDLGSSLRAGLTVDAATIAWWLEQSDAARREITDSSAVPLADVLTDLAAFVRRGDEPRVWARGTDFDLAILRTAYRNLGLELPWPYNAGRDVRTIVDAAGLLGLEVPIAFPAETLHHALHDAYNQAQHVVDLMHALRALRPDRVALREILATATRSAKQLPDASTIPYLQACLAQIAGSARELLGALAYENGCKEEKPK